MPNTNPVSELLLRWELDRQLSPDDLCRDHPELRDEVALRIGNLRAMYDVLRGAATSDGTVLAAQAVTPFQPELPKVAGYDILEELGRGGMGVVYKARQAGLNRLVALKMILAGRYAGPEAQARFRTEAEAAARLRHPHIVQIYHVGEHDGLPFYSLELVEGGSLAAAAGGRPLPPRAAAQLAEALARAMHAAHQSGVVHRDLKPANVLLTADGRPKVTDFGLAKFLDADQSLTPTLAVLGTPSYMAPEQALGRTKEVDGRSDVYSLGAILYELLTGRPPFRGASHAETVEQVKSREPEPPSRLRPGVPRNLEAVCLKCLEKAPARRYATAQALAEDLQRFLAERPTEARPRRWAGRALRTISRHPLRSAAAALGVLALVLVPMAAYWWDPDRPLNDTQRRLARGETVTLIGAKGPPRWSRWAVGDAGASVSHEADTPFSVHSSRKVVLLELLRDPQRDRFCLEAEVHHQEGTEHGRVGLYFAHAQRRSAEGQDLHGFCALTFNDVVELTRIYPNLKLPGNLVKLSPFVLTREGDDPKDEKLHPGLTAGEQAFKPAGRTGTPEPWRRLKLVVTPEVVRAYWEDPDTPFKDWPRPQLVSNAAGLGRVWQDGPPPLPPRGPLGIIVYQGSALFRSVRLTPLGE
jgi:serine/threonine-protein kinase